jgi:hypothetical protein
MSLVVNLLTGYETAHAVGMGLDGRWQVTAVVKASYLWDQSGKATRIEAIPVVELDELAGDSPSAGVLQASEFGPPKPKVDVLLAGALAFPRPTTEVEVVLSVGSRLLKKARVFGDRLWVPGVASELVPSQPRAVARAPIAWERSFGGEDPTDPKCIEPRNPAGTGVAKDAKSLHGKPAPNFEDPTKPLGTLAARPDPVGFGPIAGHWQPRIRLAGTFDETWQNKRRPLPPEDFSTAYFNVAPMDQQLDGYQPGEVLRLLNMTTEIRDQFALPDLAVPMAIVSSDGLEEAIAVVDTIVIEPEMKLFSLVAKVQAPLPDGPQSLGQIIVGPLTRGMRLAIETGKWYPWRHRWSKNA